MKPINSQLAIKKIRESLKLPEAKKLLTPYWRQKNKESNIHSTGFCYIATEALFYMIGGTTTNFRPCYAKENDETHWWLTDGIEKLDPTFDQYFPDDPPYHLGKRSGFLNGYKNPSKRAKILILLSLQQTSI